MNDYPEWTVEQWEQGWSIHVGKAYACGKCNNMIMVTRGGIGVLDPSCCGEPMRPCQEKEISGDTGRDYHN